MKKGILAVVFLSVLLLMPACKGTESSSTPTTTPTTQGIVVTSNSDMNYIGSSETFAAMATMSDGSTKAVTGGSWGGDNANVATVESATGKVTIVGSGNVNIFVDSGGKRGSKAIRGLPNYQGGWTGSYYIVACYCSGYFCDAKWCDNFPVNRVFPANFNLTQNRDAVSGTFYMGTLSAATSGSVASNGRLILPGTVYQSPTTLEVAWDLQSTVLAKITGSMNWRATVTGVAGDSRLSANVRDMNIAGFGPPYEIQLRNPTLQDIYRALIHR